MLKVLLIIYLKSITAKVINTSVKTQVNTSMEYLNLTRDFGHPILKDHLAGLVALGRASGYDWDILKN